MEDDGYRLAEEPTPQRRPLPSPVSPAPPNPSATQGQHVAPRTADSLPYFMVGYDRIFRAPKLFRAYLDGNELLFIFAGPFHASMIEKYQAQYSEAVKRGAVAGLSAGAVGAGAVAAGLAIDWVAGKFLQRGAAERAKALDAMTTEQLRGEVDANKQSFRVSAGNVISAVVEPPSTGFWSMDTGPGVPAFLRLKHQPTGKWHFMLMTDGDVALAVRGQRQAVSGTALKILVPGRA